MSITLPRETNDDGRLADLFAVSQADGQEVIRVKSSGMIFWRGREVETDLDYRITLLQLFELLVESNDDQNHHPSRPA